MVSIIVPAHNEASVIGRCLESVLSGGAEGLEVLVVCNGCTDDTAEVAGQFGSPVRVLECGQASKAAALRMGDEAATGFPRVYMDADVVMVRESLDAIAAALDRPGVCAAAPRAKTDLSGCSWPVRAFYRIWMATPYFQDGMIGCGVYALNRRGRSRFETFPDLIADDGYIRALFDAEERVSVGDAEVTVKAPRDIRSLVQTSTRSRLGGYQLRHACPEIFQRERTEKSYSKALWSWFLRPWQWPSVGVYCIVNVVSRIRAKRQLGSLGSYRWERDETTRRIEAEG